MKSSNLADVDAEAEPPDGQLGEIEESIGAGEGDAVVGSDRRRQALDQAMAMQDGMDGAFGRDAKVLVEPADQEFADLARTPNGASRA